MSTDSLPQEGDRPLAFSSFAATVPPADHLVRSRFSHETLNQKNWSKMWPAKV